MRRYLPALAILLAPTAVSAHIRITTPTPRSSDLLKERHCGQTGSTRANVQTFRPGATVHLVWDEYTVHPGWFRVSFQQNGDIFEIPPASNGPSSTGPSNYPTEDLTGKTDPGTGSLIIADRITHGTLSMDVPLPNVECNNCTLQLIQMMTDRTSYSIDPTSNNIYFACVDLVLSATAPMPDAGPVGTGPDGGVDNGGGGTTSGGCSTTGATSAVPGIVLLAAFGLLRRRRVRA